MASRTLRRRLHHGDVDGNGHEHLDASGLDSLNEPLLRNYDHDDKCLEVKLLDCSLILIFFLLKRDCSARASCPVSNEFFLKYAGEYINVGKLGRSLG